MVRRFFSASSVLGSRAGSVGVGVAGCPGAAWVFSARSRLAPFSLALLVPAGVSASILATAASAVARRPGVISVAVRRCGGRVFLRVHGSASSLRSVAVWWSGVR